MKLCGSSMCQKSCCSGQSICLGPRRLWVFVASPSSVSHGAHPKSVEAKHCDSLLQQQWMLEGLWRWAFDT